MLVSGLSVLPDLLPCGSCGSCGLEIGLLRWFDILPFRIMQRGAFFQCAARSGSNAGAVPGWVVRLISPL